MRFLKLLQRKNIEPLKFPGFANVLKKSEQVLYEINIFLFLSLKKL